MKNLILKSTLFLGAALLMGLGAQAQNLKVSIPFAFDASGKSLPAGSYEVTRNMTSSVIYTMRNMASRDAVLLFSPSVIEYSRTDAKLVFLQAADGFHLTELWNGSKGVAVRAPRGRNSILASTKPITRVIILAQK